MNMKSKVEDILAASRIGEAIGMQKAAPKKNHIAAWVLGIVGAVVLIAAIAYAVYYFFTPDYLEDFEDDFEDDFDDDFFKDDAEAEEDDQA